MKLTDAQLQQFERDGYLFMPNLFRPAEVAVLADEVQRAVELRRPEVLRAETGELRALLAMERYSEPFARLMRHPRLVEPAMQVLGGPVYMHQYKVVAKDPFGAARLSLAPGFRLLARP
jgi:ectoine hydroxylase